MVCWLPRKLNNFNFSPYLTFSKCHFTLWHLDKSSPAKAVNVIFDDMFPLLSCFLQQLLEALKCIFFQSLGYFYYYYCYCCYCYYCHFPNMTHTAKENFATSKLICEWISVVAHFFQNDRSRLRFIPETYLERG